MKTQVQTLFAVGLLAISGALCDAAAKEKNPRIRHQIILKGEGEVSANSLMFSPDGKLLASIASKRLGLPETIRLWNVAAARCIAEFRHPRGAYQVAFNPDGKTLASCGYRKIILWDVGRRINLATLETTGLVYSIVFSSDGKTLTGVEKGYLTAWSVEKKTELRTREQPIRPAPVFAYPNVKRPVVAISDETSHTFTLLDAVHGKAVLTCEGHDKTIVCFAMDGSEKIVASADEGAVWLWNRDTGGQIARVDNPPDAAIISPLIKRNGKIHACALSPDGKILAWAYSIGDARSGRPRAGGFRLFEVPSGKLLIDMPQEGGVNALAFSPDGRLLATGSYMDIDVWSVPDAWRKKEP